MRHNLHISKPHEPDIAALDRIRLKFKPTIERGPMILLCIKFAVSKAAEFAAWVKTRSNRNV